MGQPGEELLQLSGQDGTLSWGEAQRRAVAATGMERSSLVCKRLGCE